MRSFSLRIKLMILIVLAILPVAVLEIGTATEQQQRAKETAKADAMRLTRLFASHQQAVIESVRQLLMVLSEMEGVQRGYNGDCQVLFQKLLKENPVFSTVGAANVKGEVFCSAPELKMPTNVADRLFFRKAAESGAFAIGEYTVGRITHKPTLHLAAPILDETGKVSGIVYVGLDLQLLSEFGKRVALPPGGAMSMSDEKGTFLVRYPDPARWIGQQRVLNLSAATGASREAIIEAKGADGVDRIYAVNEIDAAGIGRLFITVGISKKEAYAPFRREMLRQLVFMAGIASLAVAATWFLGSSAIVHPARNLVGVARALSAGRLDVRSTAKEGEFGEIGTAFNQMAENLSKRISELNEAQKELRTAHDELELHVQERTEELRQARERLVDAIENLDAGFVMFGPEGRLVICNQTFRTMFALCAEMIQPGVLFEDILHAFVLRGGQVDGETDMERWVQERLMAFRVADGRQFDQNLNGRWIRVSDHRMRDGGVVSLRTDVTNLKQIQETLILRDRAIAVVVSGVIITDPLQPDNPIIDVNPAFERITGYSKDESIGRNCRFLQGPESEPEAVDLIRESLEQGQECHAVLKNYRKNGTLFWNEIKISPVRDASGGILHWVGVITDVSERVEAQKALDRVLAELHRSNQELEHFAYMVSHDLQEPLRMVASYTQLLGRRYKDQLDNDGRDFIGYAVDGAQRMQQFIQDLLQYSRVGTHGRPFEWVRVGEVIRRAMDNLRFAIEEKKAKIICGPMPELEADPVQLTQLFQNLIGNAMKFARNGEVRVEINATRREGEWEFTVHDNGIGISPEDAERIFVIFQRLHTRQEYVGTGIGLAICKRIVERHRGRIWVESELSHGATFHFTIPERHEEVG